MAKQSPIPVLYEPQAINMAPVNPLLQLQRGETKLQSSLQEALKRKLEWHLKVEIESWKQMYLTGYEIANFIEGRQFLRPNPWSPGTYLSYVPKTTNEANKRSLNITRFYTTNALWKWQLSNPDIVAVAGIDTEQAREAAKAADLIVEHYERKFFTPLLTIKEALHGLCWGTYLWRVRYDDSQHSTSAMLPLYGDQEVTLGEGYGQCGDCGMTGTAQNFPLDPASGMYSCPQCGGEALVEQATDTVPSVIGQQQVDLGEITCELIPFPECRWDLNHRAEDSSWFIHQRRTSLTAVRRLLGPVKVPQGTEQDYGLELLQRIAFAGQSGGGQARQDYKSVRLHEEPVTVVEYSLGPDDIADIVLKSPEDTISGQTIPAGPLLNTFPNGLTVQGLNGLQVITGVFDEHHSKSIVQGVWHSRVTSGAGQGFNDLIEVQKRFNADDSQIHAFLRATGTPALLFRQEALGDQDRAEYIGDPRMNVAVNSQNLPEGTRLEDVVRPAFQPQSVPGQLFQYTYDRLNDLAQLTSHITDFSGGLPNVNNRTATGAQISQANSNALFTPPLQIKGEIRQRIARIVVELYRTHFPIQRYFPLKGKYGRQQGRYLSASDLCTDVQFEVVKDSELPRNMFTKREDFTAFFMMLGGAAGYTALQQMNPELTLEMERNFNIQLNSDTYDQIASLCTQRIQQMKDIAPMISMMPELAPQQPMQAAPQQPPPGGGGEQEGAPDMQGNGAQSMQPMMPTGPELLLTAIQPPPCLEEPDHQLKAKYLSEWLDFDEGQTADPGLRQAVILLIQAHFEWFGIQSALVAQQQGTAQGLAAGPQGNAPPEEESDTPDVNNDRTNPNERGPITGRPKGKKK